jgi:hypothetical protein
VEKGLDERVHVARGTEVHQTRKTLQGRLEGITDIRFPWMKLFNQYTDERRNSHTHHPSTNKGENT